MVFEVFGWFLRFLDGFWMVFGLIGFKLVFPLCL